MNPESVQLKDCLAEVVENLTVRQLEHLLAVKRARKSDTGPTRASEQERISAQADPATLSEFLDLPRRVANVVACWRSIPIDDDIIGGTLTRHLVEILGIDRVEAERLVLDDGVAWPRARAA